MKYIDWDPEKNEELLRERGISFDMIVARIEDAGILDRIRHPNNGKYPNQWMYVVEVGGYAYVVPFVEDDEKIFFKTIIPSRKFTKQYLKK